MKYPVGMENGDENRSVAWVLGHPGCFAYGIDARQALDAAPAAVHEYVKWIERRCQAPWITPEEPVEVELAENFDVIFVNEQYEVVPEGYGINAWFLDDWKPLTAEDLERGLLLLEWSRRDLLDTVAGLDRQTWEWKPEGERWSIEGIVRHTGGAEWWYLDRLGLAYPRQEVPEDPLRRLEAARTRLVAALPSLVGSKLVVGVDAEFWSPRKLLRRAVWHERDHTQHIRSLLSQREPGFAR